jgi:hypothetical protein
MESVEANRLGSARASRAGDRALAIANFSEDRFGEGAKTSTRGARAPQIKK